MDVTKQAGLDNFATLWGRGQGDYSRDPGSGVALMDYDRRLAGHSFCSTVPRLPPERERSRSARHAASQQSRRHFHRRYGKAGVANERWGFGVAVGDYDNDGWPDIYVSNFGKPPLPQQP